MAPPENTKKPDLKGRKERLDAIEKRNLFDLESDLNKNEELTIEERRRIIESHREFRFELARSIAGEEFKNNLDAFPARANDTEYRKNIEELVRFGMAFDKKAIAALTLDKGKNRDYVNELKAFHALGVFVDHFFIESLTLHKAQNKKYMKALKDLAAAGVKINARVFLYAPEENLYVQDYVTVIRELYAAGIDGEKQFDNNYNSLLENLSLAKARNKRYVAALKELHASGVFIDAYFVDKFDFYMALDADFVQTMKALNRIGVIIDGHILSNAFYLSTKDGFIVEMAKKLRSIGIMVDYQAWNKLLEARVAEEEFDFEFIKSLRLAGFYPDSYALKPLIESSRYLSGEAKQFLLKAVRAGIVLDEYFLTSLLENRGVASSIFSQAREGKITDAHFAALKRIADAGIKLDYDLFGELSLDILNSAERVDQFIKTVLEINAVVEKDEKIYGKGRLLRNPEKFSILKKLKSQGVKITDKIINMVFDSRDYSEIEHPKMIELLKMLQKYDVFLRYDFLDVLSLDSLQKPGYINKIAELVEMGMDDINDFLQLSLEDLNQKYNNDWKAAVARLRGAGVETDIIDTLGDVKTGPFLDALLELANAGISLYMSKDMGPKILDEGFREFLIEAHKRGIRVNGSFVYKVDMKVVSDASYRKAVLELYDADIPLSSLVNSGELAVIENPDLRNNVIALSKILRFPSEVAQILSDKKTHSPEFIEALSHLKSIGISIDKDFVEALTLEKAGNKQYMQALVRLHNNGIHVTAALVMALKIPKASNAAYLAALEKFRKLGVYVDDGLVHSLEIDEATSSDFDKVLAALRELKSLGVNINDGPEIHMDPPRAASKKYMEALKNLRLAGIRIGGDFIGSLSLRKGESEIYLNSLKKLKEADYEVDVGLLNVLTLSKGENEAFVNGLCRLRKMGIRLFGYTLAELNPEQLTSDVYLKALELIMKTDFKEKTRRVFEEGIFKYFDLERASNAAYMKILLPEIVRRGFNPDAIRAADSTYLADKLGLGKDDGLDIFSRYTEGIFAKLYEAKKRKDADPLSLKIIETAIQMQALPFIRRINNLHNEPDEIRQNEVKQLPPEALYALVVHGVEELYTSSFQKVLFPVIMDKMKTAGMDAVDFINHADPQRRDFRLLLQVFSKYNRIDQFLATIKDREKKKMFLRDFIFGLDEKKYGLENAVAISETLQLLRKNKSLIVQLEGYLREAYESASGNEKVMYGIIASMHEFNARTHKKFFEEIHKTYEIENMYGVKHNDLINKDGEIIQWYFFYGDEDGRSSFEHMMSLYRADSSWEFKEEKKYWVLTKRGKGKLKIIKYVTKPEEDDAAHAVSDALSGKDLSAIEIVHRGHSYHVRNTLYHIPHSARVVYLGSCGGFNNINSVLRESPKAHIISTKGTGTMAINDPLLKMLDEEMLKGNGIDWENFWQKARERIRDKRFDEYINPADNASALLITAYRKYSKREE